MELACQRHCFSLPDDLHYLNCAYMAPLSRRVEAAGIAGVRRKRVPSRIQPADFFEESDAVRKLFAALINAPGAAPIALVPAVSYGMATVVRNTHIEAGQNIVLAQEQFPSNVHPWRRLQREKGLVLRAIAPPDGPRQRGPRWNERLLEAIDRHTALVALGHVHWTDGTLFDVERIGQRCREVGAAFIIDGTQSVGALPFDVARIQPDALICAGYKWLLGPYSLGVAYFGPRYEGGAPLEETWIARRGSEDFAGLVAYPEAYQPGAVRYDVGERSNFALLPMLHAALQQVHAWGVANIQDYCRTLTHAMLRDVGELGYQIEADGYRSTHLFGVRLPASFSAERLREALAARNISVSIRGSAIRVSPHVYNDEADVEALRDAFYEGVGAAPRPTYFPP